MTAPSESSPLRALAATPKRICCNCQKEIVGGAMTSGGVFWHPISCLSVATASLAGTSATFQDAR